MNKAELIDALAARLGDRRTATAALDAVLAEVQAAVAKGDRVAITGFGVFEKRVRGPRIARNPRTGETVRVKKTSVPTFKPGTGFREMVAAGRPTKAAKAAKKAAPAKRAAVKTAPATRKAATAKKTTAAKAATTTAKRAATGTKATGIKAAGAKKTTAKKTTAAKKAATTRKTIARR